MSTVNGGWQGPKIIKEGLVLYLDAGSPNSFYSPTAGVTWNDISGFQNNGTLINGPTFSSDNGGSIVFDGVNDSVNIGILSPVNNASSLTICYWMKKSASNKDMIVGSQISSTNGIWLQWYLDGNIYFSSRNGSFTTVSFALSYDSNWKYLVGVYGNSSGTIYVNGSSVATGTGMPSSLSLTAGNSFTVGNLNNSFPSTGNIANVQIYNRALSAQEILQNYNATRARFGI